MKHKISNEHNVFKPFDLTITVDSLEELKALWIIFNCSDGTIEDFFKDVGESELSTADIKDFEVWKTLDNKLKENGVFVD